MDRQTKIPQRQDNVELRQTPDLRGKRFGQLAVLSPWCRDKGVWWLCCCECGQFALVRHDRLTSGKTASCGCLKIKAMLDTIQEVQARQLSVFEAVRHGIQRGAVKL